MPPKDEVTLTELGAALGLPKERVERIEKRAIFRLWKALSWGADAVPESADRFTDPSRVEVVLRMKGEAHGE